MNCRSLAVAAVGMAFLAVNAFAQITTIEGIVKGPDGKPVQNAEVHITRTDIKGNYKTKTDKKGHYLYMGLPMGFYDIEIVIEGKTADKQSKIRTSPGDPVPVNFDLGAAQQANARQQAAMQQASTTGQLTDDAKRGMSKEQVAAMEKSIKEQSDKIKKNKELNDAFNEGMTDVTNKQYDQAVAAFQKASEMDPNQLAVWTNMADAYVKNAEGKTGPDFDSNMQKGLDAYGKALALKPDDAGLHNNYGLALAKAKKFDDAQAELKKAADMDPPNGGKYYYNLGALLVNAGQPQVAGDAFKKAIELTPSYADAYYQYGVTLLGQAKTDPGTGKVTPAPGTVEAFQKYLEIAPTGQYAQPAKDMLASLGTSIQTKFDDPNAKKSKKK
jgi:tetratricopeptide (TPR) repeat protein